MASRAGPSDKTRSPADYQGVSEYLTDKA
jgi:hypothetical protein